MNYRKKSSRIVMFKSGVTVIVGLSYSLIDQKNLISGDAEIRVLVLFIVIACLVTMIINNRKYK